VRDGLVVAGPLVRLACARHLTMRTLAAAGHPKGYAFDEAAADVALDFFEQSLVLSDTADDDGIKQAFRLLPYQVFILGNLFGWKRPTGYRLYRDAYIETGKGSGKTPLLAGIGLYGLVMDGEQSPYIVSAANSQKQARFLWNDAKGMVENSPDLRPPVVEVNANALVYPANDGRFEPVSSEKRGLDGPRPHMGLMDEVHEHISGDVVGKIRAGAKRRKQPLFVEITNAGFDRTSICWAHHEHSRQILQGISEDDAWFAYVCGLDETDDPLTQPACWPKANPGLPMLPTLEYLEREVEKARNIPADANLVLRLNFCVWTQSQSRFFDPAQWAACASMVADAELLGQPCFAGFDSGQTDDFSALALVWAMEDGRVAVRMRYWLPQAAVEKYRDRPYQQWQTAGRLEVTDGNVIYYDQIEQAIEHDCRNAGVRSLHMDKAFVGQMMQHLQDAGLPVVDQPQGYKLNEAIQRLSSDVASGRLCTGDDPILRWMSDNAVVRTGRMRELRLDKDASKDKIDGIAALAMAYEAMIRGQVTSQESLVTIWE
jgi:phage terminase large subunit-like protein